MITELRYGDDKAKVHCVCRFTRADSQEQFVYIVTQLLSKYDTVKAAHHEYFFPGFSVKGESQMSDWTNSEAEARERAINKLVTVFDEFNGWPSYFDHAYLPGEVYDGPEKPTPPGQDPHAPAAPVDSDLPVQEPAPV